MYLLFRLTAAADSYGGPFTDNVTRYTNTQNSVKVPALFSNDPIQQWLAENFKLISGRGPVPAMHYRYRSGHRPEDGPGKGITIEQLASIRHAFLYGPVPSYREPAQFFDRELRYAEAFGIDGKDAGSWPEEELFKTAAAITINQRVREISRTLAVGPQPGRRRSPVSAPACPLRHRSGRGRTGSHPSLDIPRLRNPDSLGRDVRSAREPDARESAGRAAAGIHRPKGRRPARRPARIPART